MSPWCGIHLQTVKPCVLQSYNVMWHTIGRVHLGQINKWNRGTKKVARIASRCRFFKSLGVSGSCHGYPKDTGIHQTHSDPDQSHSR